MLAEQRLAFILNQVKQNNFCSVQQLAADIGVSQATIRRDLQTLASQELVRLTRGGVMNKLVSTTAEPEYAVKSTLNLDEKIRIGRAACSMIHPGDTILLDTGTTTYQMTAYLNQVENVTVVTNDIRIAADLAASPDIQLCMLGGLVRKGYYTTTGQWAQTALEGLHVDKAFVSCDSLHISAGATITNSEEISVKQSMIKAGNVSILLADHSKFENIAFMRLCGVEKFSAIITGVELDSCIAQEYRAAGVNLIQV